MGKQIPDITARLTAWCHSPQSDSAQDIMDEAAKEIERLRSLVRFQDGVIRSGDVACLTSDEREAIGLAMSKRLDLDAIFTLRSLLERTK
jgi:hypothetical protein